jgi:hypothetical protein
MPDSEYLWTFHGLVDAVKYLGGDIGINEHRVLLYLEKWGQDPDDPQEWKDAKALIWEQYLGVMFYQE